MESAIVPATVNERLARIEAELGLAAIEPTQAPEPLNADRIIRAVCAEFTITHDEITSPCRESRILHPRQVAMFLCRKLLGLTYGPIARRLGCVNHGTARHAFLQVGFRLACDKELCARLERIKEGLVQ